MPDTDAVRTTESVRGRSSVADETVVVTGASSGIGRAIAETFVADGADVVICSRTQADVDAVAEELNAADRPGSAFAVECDVTDRDSVASFADATVEEFGGVDVLVNNAGGAGPGAPLHGVEPDDWDGVIEVNLTGTYNVTRAFADALREDGGAVVNTSSMAGRYGVARMGPYSAAKAGVSALTRTLAVEWAGDDVRVNAVEPGFIATPAVREWLGVEEMPERDPVDRTVGTPEEVADAVRFLASDAASFVTGQTLSPTGPPNTFEPPAD
ncbi:SDR family NAD(P)-dependent oxidoreductase [Halopelagius longus]|uniref:3-oxoacyl-[acyl-carrier protein] reductase n=1 Tax=Halopelagius longus TaxID=1236180 RepID=A0A1H0XVE0_9EURY|nr:SDR family NAD(P)-dependent oxidoreductase [Halopelagius longus]RDI73100.1 SDR family oxidoreductase [Halopelagius longus]SDQ06850.1 3-oxoacyl-[acyl-carrier protein] reductase [Halopelagius longus]